MSKEMKTIVTNSMVALPLGSCTMWKNDNGHWKYGDWAIALCEVDGGEIGILTSSGEVFAFRQGLRVVPTVKDPGDEPEVRAHEITPPL